MIFSSYPEFSLENSRGIQLNKGFTLIELAIVIVIIGMIVGAITAGQTIIRGAQLQAVISDYQMYNAAVKGFRDKYKELPGDMSVANGLTLPAMLGNGNGLIEMAAGAPPTREHIFAWKHLGESGFITGNYTGDVVAANSCDLTPNVNAPGTRVDAARWQLATGLGGTDYFGDAIKDLPRAHLLWLGGAQQGDCTYRQLPVLNGADAYAMDKKNDDSFSDSGKMRAQNTTVICYVATPAAGNYTMAANNATNCSLVFFIDQ